MSRCARLGAVQIEVVSADGTTLVARGYGSGPPVVLVHGSSGGLDSWDGVAPFLADAFEVWVYARRGYAPSGEGTDDKTFTDDVADLLAVVQAAGGDAHVVGASYGGTVGLHAAASNPVVMRSLALFEPPLFASGTALLPVLESYESLIASGDLAGGYSPRRSRRYRPLCSTHWLRPMMPGLGRSQLAATWPRRSAACTTYRPWPATEQTSPAGAISTSRRCSCRVRTAGPRSLQRWSVSRTRCHLPAAPCWTVNPISQPKPHQTCSRRNY